MSIKRISIYLIGLVGTFLLLTACGTAEMDSGKPNDLTVELTTERHDLVFDIEISDQDTIEDIEAAYKAKVVVWQAEAGFAVLAGSESEHLAQQNILAESNLDSMSSPALEGEVHANGAFGAGAFGVGAFGAGAFGAGVFGTGTFGTGTFAHGVNESYILNNKEEWNQIDLFEAHQMATNLAEGIKIAVIDTGLDLDHSHLRNNLAPASEWIDLVDADRIPEDETGGSMSGHGTAVAGIILQVAPKATILPIRVLSSNGLGDTSDVVAAIAHAVASGVDIINLSIGVDENSTVMKKMIRYAREADVYVFAATGNRNFARSNYPAAHSEWSGVKGWLFGVGSVSLNNSKSQFSNYGTGLSFHAPGEAIHTIYPGELWVNATGTSFATPIAAGEIALFLGEKGNRNLNIATTINASLSNLVDNSHGFLSAKKLLANLF